MTSPNDRFRENLRAASQIKLQPEIWFSCPLASYVRHLACHEQLHPDAMAISLLNIVAITCRNSWILRRGKAYVPLNLYDFVVAKSGYGKSDILSTVERSVKQCVHYHIDKFLTMSTKNENTQREEEEIKKKKNKAEEEQFNTTMNKRTKPVLPMPRVIFNDGTGAGILSQLDSCTRALCLHEADTTMGSWNIMQSGPLDRTSSRVDPFRSTLMTLYEDPGNFTRLLKNELINTGGSKLILLGASTGELIISQLGRVAGRLMADAFFERITLFPVAGDPIANEDCLPEIDTTRYPSLDQFGVICGFLSDIKLQLDEVGDVDLARLTLEMKKTSNSEHEDDHLSSRLAKTSQFIYRLAGFLCLLENAAKIAETYLAHFGSFGDGQPNEMMFDRIRSIVEKDYECVFKIGTNQHLIVENSVASRAKDVALANLEQYKLLLFVDKDDGRNWNIVPGGQLKFVSPRTSMGLQSLHSHQGIYEAKLEKPIRRVVNLLKKTNPLKVNVLLHDSIIFVKSSLYIDWKLKVASAIVDKTLLSELVTEGLLLSIDAGIVGKRSKPMVYIKTVPGGEVSREDLDRMLASYCDERLTMDSYLHKCKTIKIEGSGKVSKTVFDVFNRPEYQAMGLDLTALINLKASQKIVTKRLQDSNESGSMIDDEVTGELSMNDETNNRSVISVVIDANIPGRVLPTIQEHVAMIDVQDIPSVQPDTYAVTTMNIVPGDDPFLHESQAEYRDLIGARLRPRTK